MDKTIVAGLYPGGDLSDPLSRQVFLLPGDAPRVAEKGTTAA